MHKKLSGLTLQNFSKRNLGGFTLIELIIAISIVFILLTVTVLDLDPGEFMSQSKDTQRISDLKRIDTAVSLAKNSPRETLENSVEQFFVYVSLPDTNNNLNDDCKTSGEYPNLPVLTGGWKYRCAANEQNLKNADGTGWIPVNFDSISGNPLKSLPIDPENDETAYYTFSSPVLNNPTSANSFSLAAPVKSEKYQGEAVNDGGVANNSGIYETQPVSWETASSLNPVVGVNWTLTKANDNNAWVKRYDFPTVVYNNKMWVIGGSYSAFGGRNDVWSSTDGVTWTEATPNAGWNSRMGLEAIVYNNKMWVLGGYDSDGAGWTNDVWSSTDGVTWTQATANAGWPIRSDFTALVYNNKMWVIGGYNGTTRLNDVWSSTDGVTWTQATASAGWSPRRSHTAVVYGNRMWVMGGTESFGGGGPYRNDVWWSADGVTWTEATPNAGWSARAEHASVVFDSRMWVLGGSGSLGENSEVWYSLDGETWVETAIGTRWSDRGSFPSLAFDNKMWIFGGSTGSPSYFNDVWFTP